MGCILTAGLKQGPARQASLKAGLTNAAGCTTVNKQCGSGKRATNATGTSDGELYTGVFTVTTRAPRTADQIASNPLGLLISDFSWSRER